jgi:UDP-N-acetylglucosamine/UDP-N-acetylgalactosamine diphosphorylase
LVNVFAVDNILQRIADPSFVGATILSGADCGSKVVRKCAPDEKVGVMCKVNGHPSIIEYYEMSEEMTQDEKEFFEQLKQLEMESSCAGGSCTL